MGSSLNRTLHGIGWGGLSTTVNVLFQLVFMAIMARLLDPIHFGLIAMANVMLRFLTYFAQMGVGPALIQKPVLEDGDVRAALSVSLGISAACTVIAVIAAPFAANFFNMPTLTSVMQALSANFLLGGISVVSLSLLRRQMRFKNIAMIESSAYVLGYGLVGITMAYLGFGVWALVGAVLSQSVIMTTFAYLVSRHEFGWRHLKQQRVHFFKFGARYSIIGFIEFLSGSLDAVIIGKFFGTAATGMYGRASLLANLPVQQPANIITGALFPVISRLGNQRQLDSLQISVLVLGSYAFAVTFGMIAAAPDIVAVLLGNKWLEAIPILQILALSVAPQYLSHLVGVTLDAMGELKPKLKIQGFVLALQVIAFALLLPYGLVGIACAIVIAEWTRFGLMAALVVKLLHPPLREFRLILSIALLNGWVAFSLIWMAAHALPVAAPRWVALILEIVAGGAALIFVSWGGRKALGRLPVVIELVQRVPHLSRFIPVVRHQS
ncbi:lipopolysaccharide exporter [Actimicrobium sp. GrIS 1.19]|uniref:lipopolysaccharide biosynthesis protein n=1 Tax=Actimicrobium sp. GrIS 1.19 TaxID=3071708 RepID=UPI002E08F86E|nr:lipopolysaccharide exporter [Actimicrobium sp. GrIS 1.19]